MKCGGLVAICMLAMLPRSARGTELMPQRFLKVEAIALGGQLEAATQSIASAPRGYTSWAAFHYRLASITYTWRRLRVGGAVLDGYGLSPSGDALLPVHVGFTLSSRPRKTWRVYSTLPDAYVEATASFADVSSRFDPIAPNVRVALACDWDFFGAGARLEAGWVIYRFLDYVGRGESVVYAGAQLRLVTFGIGL